MERKKRVQTGRNDNMDSRRMNNAALASNINASDWEPKFPFDLVVAYEDTDTRNRALHLYDTVAQQLLDDYDFQCSWWKFEHLANETLRQQAADAAVDANMVILSIRAREDLSPTHKLWIEDWISRRSPGKAALVVMIAGTTDPERDAAPAIAYLRNAARKGRMDFFTHAFELPPPLRVVDLSTPAGHQSVTTPILQGILQHRSPIPRWGINE